MVPGVQVKTQHVYAESENEENAEDGPVGVMALGSRTGPVNLGGLGFLPVCKTEALICHS